MGDIDGDFYGPQATVYMIRRHSPAGLNRAVVPVDADDCAPGLETPGNASLCWVLTRPEVQAALRLRALVDHDHDRPSPGDDLTHAAFDEMDRER